jgi:hypothetical protein
VQVRLTGIALVIGTLALSGGCSSSSRHQGLPSPTAGQTTTRTAALAAGLRDNTPVALLRAGICTVPSSDKPRAAAGPLQSRPIAVEAVWLRALGQRPCYATTRYGNSGLAALLSRDIAAAPALPRETHCPSDDGSRVVLYFANPGAAAVTRIDIGLTGCTVIIGPRLTPRRATSDLFSDLLSLEPPNPWRATIAQHG